MTELHERRGAYRCTRCGSQVQAVMDHCNWCGETGAVREPNAREIRGGKHEPRRFKTGDDL